MSVWAVRALWFPAGIPGAWSRLESIYPPRPGRRFYGLTRIEEGREVYYAAVEQQTVEAETPGRVLSLDVAGGRYARVKLADWPGHIDRIGEMFARLESTYEVKAGGFFIEFYRSRSELHLMVPLVD